ncbi:9830_t:CDS:2 [Paraglomus brasilianum]|uniref:9830_t:CDS:1 n=1 Tax=Paraglomus brasilianum TaxID=144538 RepID=A0A9N9BGR4_9GLOM|nr:9830_t:CDS:2 [Paraglomus brasilianum]
MYPDKSATKLTNLYSEGLKGHLDLSNYADLEELRCDNNQLTSIDVSKNTKLKKLKCSNNKLKEINFGNNINLEELRCNDNELISVEFFSKLSSSKKLTFLDIVNNNFSKRTEIVESRKQENNSESQDLSFLKSFTNLEGLYLGNNDKKRIKAGNYNKFYGSLECLNNLDELKILDIRNTDIDSGLSYLLENNSLKEIYCSSKERPESKVNEIEKELKSKSSDFSYSESEGLKLKEFRGSDNEFANLKDIIDPIDLKSLTYFNITNNKISDSNINVFDKFTDLKSLYIGNTEEGGGTNRFKGSLEDLKGLEKLSNINISKNEIKIGKFLSKQGADRKEDKDSINSMLGSFNNLERIYYKTDKNEKLKRELQSCYKEEDGFFDVRLFLKKGLLQGTSQNTKVEAIVKVPLLSGGKSKHSVNKINENYNVEGVNYKIKAVWPLQAGFSWKVDEELELNKLPLRLCHVDEKNSSKIEIKTRIDCAKDAKKYAILSYFWGEDTKEKGHEVSRMRDYYGNAAVTLVAIQADIGEEVIRELTKSFEPGATSKTGEDNRHRIDLIRIEEGHENLIIKDKDDEVEKLEVAEKQFIIGLGNQENDEYQAQIEIPPKK